MIKNMMNTINYELLAEQQLEQMNADLLESTIDYGFDDSSSFNFPRHSIRHTTRFDDEVGFVGTSDFLSFKYTSERSCSIEAENYSSEYAEDQEDEVGKELESFKPRATGFEFTESSSFDEVKANLEEYQQSQMPAVREAEAEEVKIYGDINTEAFLATRFDAVIDWLDLKFTVDPKKCDFWFKPTARSHIKAFITRHTGIKHYVADKGKVVQDGASFTIRLHDVENRKSLRAITSLLSAKYGCKVEDMSVEAIELSLDCYDARNSALLIALHKSLKYPTVVNRMRVYKTRGTVREVPESPHELYMLLEDGYNLATGDHRMEEFCTRIYFKRTDKNGAALPPDQHRLRVEVTLRKTFFEKAKIDCGLDNLANLINHGFKQLTFTKLSNRATQVDRKKYRDLVLPFGQEQRMTRSSSGHKRRLSDEIESFGMLNERKRLSVKALADKFKVRKNR